MALIVEDGSGLSTAEAYASVAEADAYLTVRSNPAAWTSSSTAQKEAALRAATDYLEAVAGVRWRGTRYASTQRLSWPRDGVWLDGNVLERATLPRLLKEACIEAAARARSETNGLLPDESERNVAAKAVAAGPVSQSVTYLGTKSARKAFTVVDLLLAPLLWSAGQMERA